MPRHYPYPRVIRHACGHQMTHTLMCSHAGEARSQEFNLAQSDCFDCIKATELLETELNLPPLRGSNRIVGWGSTLRLRLAKALRKYGYSDAVEGLKRITEAKWFVDHREEKLTTIAGMLTR